MKSKVAVDNQNHNTDVNLPLQAKGDTPIPVSEFPSTSVFNQSTTFPALIIPVKRTAELRNSLSSVLLHRPKTRNVYPHDEGDNSKRKLVLKNRDAWHDEGVQRLLSEGCEKSDHTITVKYEDLTVEEVLKQLLPDDIQELPSAFELVGKLAHLNLRDEVLPYKYIVGKVILDKNSPRIKTVVNKLGSIANEYRTFGMEVIAGYDGPNWSLVSLKEEGCQFSLDFQQVYWNSRLGAEHKRLVKLIKKDAQQQTDKPIVVADLMAGVGPFAVPLTECLPPKGGHQKKYKQSNSATNIVVHANDLNPASYKYLKINAEQNKCPADRLYCYNMCGRAFCHKVQERGDGDKKPVEFQHAIMNLPASAPEFLDAFRGFSNITLPRIHVYCFAPKFAPPLGDETANENSMNEDEVNASVRERCSSALGCPLDASKHNITIRIVRDVSPNKNMLCVSFNLPEEVRKLPRINVSERKKEEEKEEAQDSKEDHQSTSEPETKRAKTSS